MEPDASYFGIGSRHIRKA